MRVNGVFRPELWMCIAIAASSLLIACGDRSPQTPESAPQGLEGTASAIMHQELTAQINRSPLFDSPEGWGPGFAKAIGHGSGVVVGPGGDNANVFAQQFPAKPGEPFKIVARASTVGKPGAKGRFQVNWTDGASKFISASIKAFDVTAAEQTFETYVEAPPGTVSGTLYVVADGPEDMVRYTEMRLLGKSDGRTALSSLPEAKSAGATSSLPSLKPPLDKADIRPSPFPRPPNLTPLDGSGRSLTVAESQYYFYQAARAMQRRARERGMDFIMYVMPDYNISRLMPAIKQLRSEGIKVLAYEPQGNWTSGVDADWYWQKADSHWTEAAVRLTADEILNMWTKQEVANRPFSKELMSAYAGGFPSVSQVSPNDR